MRLDRKVHAAGMSSSLEMKKSFSFGGCEYTEQCGRSGSVMNFFTFWIRIRIRIKMIRIRHTDTEKFICEYFLQVHQKTEYFVSEYFLWIPVPVHKRKAEYFVCKYSLQRIFRYKIFSFSLCICKEYRYLDTKYSLQIFKEKLNISYINILCRYIKKS